VPERDLFAFDGLAFDGLDRDAVKIVFYAMRHRRKARNAYPANTRQLFAKDMPFPKVRDLLFQRFPMLEQEIHLSNGLQIMKTESDVLMVATFMQLRRRGALRALARCPAGPGARYPAHAGQHGQGVQGGGAGGSADVLPSPGQGVLSGGVRTPLVALYGRGRCLLRRIAGVGNDEKAVDGTDGVLVKDGDPLHPRVRQHVLDCGWHRLAGYAPSFRSWRLFGHRVVPGRAALIV
jgi:hypothetical protein